MRHPAPQPPAFGIPDRSPPGQEGPPTRSRLVRLPLAALQDAARGGGNERVFRSTCLGARPVHRLRDLVRRVARQVLLERIAEEPAARLLGPAGQPLRSLVDLIRDRYRCFHTISITTSS